MNDQSETSFVHNAHFNVAYGLNIDLHILIRPANSLLRKSALVRAAKVNSARRQVAMEKSCF
jgi:hypothetical protein